MYLPKIKYLDLSYHKFSDEHMQYFKNVTTISLSHCGMITSKCLDHFTQITDLDISAFYYLKRNELEKIVKNNNIKRLIFNKYISIDDELIDYLQNATELEIYGISPEMTTKGFIMLGSIPIEFFNIIILNCFSNIFIT